MTYNIYICKTLLQMTLYTIKLTRSEIELLIGVLPMIEVVNEGHNATQFVTKGFPSANAELELATINPISLQSMLMLKIQLQLNEDYSSWATEDFQEAGF